MYTIHKLAHPLNKKTIFKIIKKIIISLVILLLLGVLYQYFSVKKDMKLIKLPGSQVTVFKHEMHTYEEGKGNASIVLISGNNVPCAYSEFSNLRQLLLPYGKVFTYDKCGTGLSNKSIIKLDNEDLATELKYMLKKRDVKSPYLLIAHSTGSLEALAFAQAYPKDVAGVILLNGENPETIINNYKPSKKAYLYAFLRNTGILRLECALGLVHDLNERQKYISEDLKAIDKALFLKNYYNKATIDKNNSLKQLSKKIIDEGKLKNTPILVLSSNTTNSNLNYNKDVWKNSQKDLLTWSLNSKQINLNNVGYNIHKEQPDEVVSAVKQLLTHK